jgi:hypothetical protein
MATLTADIHEHAATEPAEVRRPESLDDLVAGAWRSLAVSRSAACPVCREALTPRYSAGSRPVGGRCGGCGSELA